MTIERLIASKESGFKIRFRVSSFEKVAITSLIWLYPNQRSIQPPAQAIGEDERCGELIGVAKVYADAQVYVPPEQQSEVDLAWMREALIMVSAVTTLRHALWRVFGAQTRAPISVVVIYPIGADSRRKRL